MRTNMSKNKNIIEGWEKIKKDYRELFYFYGGFATVGLLAVFAGLTSWDTPPLSYFGALMLLAVCLCWLLFMGFFEIKYKKYIKALEYICHANKKTKKR